MICNESTNREAPPSVISSLHSDAQGLIGSGWEPHDTRRSIMGGGGVWGGRLVFLSLKCFIYIFASTALIVVVRFNLKQLASVGQCMGRIQKSLAVRSGRCHGNTTRAVD